MTVTILIGDVREQLRTLDADSVHCVVTSPPYWGLRDYGTASWQGGAADCDHSIIRSCADPKNADAPTQNGRPKKGEELNRQACRCGAQRIDSQIGLEATPAEFIAVLVDVFDEVRRVLRPEGTCWINMGDSYAGSWGSQGREYSGVGLSALSARQVMASQRKASGTGSTRGTGLKPKDLVMMPHRLAIALQDSGWWVRQDIVWSKPNPMPESVRDRCTKSHEYIFLLTKSEKYYYDAEAIKDPAVGAIDHPRNSFATKDYEVPGQKPQKRTARGVGFGHGTDAGDRQRGRVMPADMIDAGASARLGRGPGWRNVAEIPALRNKRSVWTMATHSFAEAHFATFPPELPETCIKAGCPPDGIVLDPFFGAGTTGLVADRLQRDCIGIELNPKYAEIARRRIAAESTLLADIRVVDITPAAIDQPEVDPRQITLFAEAP
jgi:DNA modification methylase